MHVARFPDVAESARIDGIATLADRVVGVTLLWRTLNGGRMVVTIRRNDTGDISTIEVTDASVFAALVTLLRSQPIPSAPGSPAQVTEPRA